MKVITIHDLMSRIGNCYRCSTCDTKMTFILRGGVMLTFTNEQFNDKEWLNAWCDEFFPVKLDSD